jgi:hypothetical protein
VGPDGHEGDEDHIKAYLNILVFDKDFHLVDAAYQALGSEYNQSGATKIVPDSLSAELLITTHGTVYVYLLNEESEGTEVYFDDFKV